MKWFTISQSLTAVIGGVIMPFYIIFLQQAADSYSLFAYLYASFTLAGALTHFAFGSLSKHISVRTMLIIGSVAPGALLLLVPSLPHIWQIYCVQVLLGICLALQKSAEKVAVARLAAGEYFEKYVGNYHGVIALITAVTLFASAWLLDTFSVIFIFYACGIAWLIAGVGVFNISSKRL